VTNASVSASRTKRDRIVDELHELILSGELPRGSRLQQDQLARRFETSITPVREALRLLESQGLVTGEAHRGVRIASINEEDLKATYLMRRLVEPYAVRRATLRVSRKNLQEASALNARMAEAGEAGDHWGVREANRALHFLFYERCGVPTLSERIRGLWLVFPWDAALDLRDRTRESFKEHEAIISAVADGELDAAASATAAHLFAGYAAVVTGLTAQPVEDPFPVDND
jgi:DNA-binding GntR family transcriptional regulator